MNEGSDSRRHGHDFIQTSSASIARVAALYTAHTTAHLQSLAARTLNAKGQHFIVVQHIIHSAIGADFANYELAITTPAV